MEKNTNKVTLKAMVKDVNSIENASYTDLTIPSDILAKLKEENDTLFENACKNLASKSKKEFFKAFFSIDIEKGLDEKDTEKAVKNAVSCKQFAIVVNDNGLLEIDTKSKVINFVDVLNAKIDLIAFKNADKKPTKADRIKANRFYFGDFGKGYIDILTHNARQFTSIGNADDTKEEYTLNANYDKSLSMLDEKYAKLKKDNPFTLQSNNAYTLQIMDIIEYFVENTDVKLFSYHCKAVFQMICNRNKFGKLTIANTNDVLNALAIIYRYAFNGYKLPTTDKTDIYKSIK